MIAFERRITIAYRVFKTRTEIGLARQCAVIIVLNYLNNAILRHYLVLYGIR
jgi:hypothetical protein